MTAILINSCIESIQEYVLNPDGSGKVKAEIIMPIDPMNMMGDEERVTKAMKDVSEFIHKSVGIDAWTDFEFKLLEDSTKIMLKATGYFKDISKISDKGYFPISFEKEPSGDYLVTIREKQDETKNLSDADDESDSQEDEAPLTEEEIKAKAKEMKKQSSFMMGMMSMMMTDLDIRSKYVFPGKIKEFDGFVKFDDRTAGLSFDGQKLMSVMQNQMKDEKYWEEKARKGDKSDPMESIGSGDDNPFTRELFNSKGKPFIRISPPMEVQFDFDKEFKKAIVEYEKLKLKFPADTTNNDSEY